MCPGHSPTHTSIRLVGGGIGVYEGSCKGATTAAGVDGTGSAIAMGIGVDNGIDVDRCGMDESR